MSLQNGRYTAPGQPGIAEGWTLARLSQPSHLFGANGMRLGADGRIYIAQVTGSQISALDLATGQLETISPQGGDIVGPDDIAFAPNGDLYATEVLNGRISVRRTNGSVAVLRDDLPAANGITFHQGRLFANECRIGGRLMELGLDGAAPRVVLGDIPMPNAMEVGPDGMLYFPVMGANEIWRVNPEGGASERVAGDLGVPDAVKFDAKGFIVSTQAASGEVLRIDPRTGDRTVLASLAPGLDNLVVVGDRLFTSHLTNGQVTEILADGATRSLLPGGMSWPLGLALGPDGTLYVSDNSVLNIIPPGGESRMAGMLFSPGWPGNIRGIAWSASGLIVTTTSGMVARYRPAESESEFLAEGYDQLYGVAVGPGGGIVAAELGGGRVISVRDGASETLATSLDRPIGVAIAGDGTCFVSEAGAGRVVKLTGGGVETVLDDLVLPHGMAVHGGRLYTVDVGAKELVELDLATGGRRTIATNLPVGAPKGVVPKPLLAFPPFAGPMGPFTGIVAGPDGTLYISADAEGSVITLRPS